MIGKLLGKRYEIIEKVGEGGMGLVYRAKDRLLKRFVAVKILKPELTENEEFINKFRKESLSSASLSHPNIVNIYDVGVEDGIYYIVMEYVNGKTLKEIIREKAPMPYIQILNISRQICLALDHAHSNSIIHRDIKPQNILITNDGIVKVADFGIARASSSATLTNTGSVLGSAYYISPEQARGSFTDNKTDIYSLGVVMYEMATGRVPFDGESPVVIALKHIQERVTPPSELNPGIPAGLEDIIMEALEKDPAMRYASAADMIDDIDKVSANADLHVTQRHDGSNDVTRVMPSIKESDIEGSTKNDGAPPGKRSRKVWIVLGVLLFTAAVVAALLFFINYSGGAGDEVAVPNIIGKDSNVAADILSSNGLSMEVVERSSDTVAKGIVISTYPDVGMNVKKGRTIKAVVSTGPDNTNVPDLSGSTESDAEYMLKAKGLKTGDVITQYNDDVDKDKIFKQSPESGTEVAKGTSVDIYVSLGQEVKVVEVPKLVGVDLGRVNSLLDPLKLGIGDIKYASDPEKPDNTVLEQSIPKGTQVKEGQKIDITVNRVVPASS